MQSYTVIIGVLEMREKYFSYRDIRSRYGIGQGTVKLIIDRANEIGLPLADIRQMEPEKVETAFYPPENIRRKEIPLPDYQLIYDRLYLNLLRMENLVLFLHVQIRMLNYIHQQHCTSQVILMQMGK